MKRIDGIETKEQAGNKWRLLARNCHPITAGSKPALRLLPLYQLLPSFNLQPGQATFQLILWCLGVDWVRFVKADAQALLGNP